MPLAAGIVFNLVARDAVDGEVARLGVREIQAGDARRRVHRVTFGKADAGCSLGIEQFE